MSKITLPNHENCTGCGVCTLACPKSAISMAPDELGVFYPTINYDLCVSCGKCQKVCHLNNEILFDRSDEVYAAYSNDEEERATSASGGVAAELYKLARRNGWHAYGVEFEHNLSANYKELITDEDYRKAKNSKYVFCDAKGVYKQILEQLSNGETVLFIGVPCQVAALISFIGNRPNNLITVDLLCHGTCPSTYLDAHINNIEKKKSSQAEEISFRDPLYYTYTYTFTLKNRGEIFYHVRPDETDVYQIGYHKGLIYKENCYGCRYAREERVGDLTISDFSGLGKLAPYSETKKSVSCVVVSSENGRKTVDELHEKGFITTDRRPSNEAFLYDKMFQHPTIPHIGRNKFKERYIRTGEFESAAQDALRSDIIQNRVKKVLHIKEARALASKIKHRLLQ